jgi:CubicO group peptidase (beta-lactamase class C family)
LATLLQTLLSGGTNGRRRLLGPMTVKAMISNQNAHLNAPWGLGWRLGNSQTKRLGDLVSPTAFGHLGSPGTLYWADPETQVVCVVLTGRPEVVDHSLFLRLVSNAVAASIEK